MTAPVETRLTAEQFWPEWCFSTNQFDHANGIGVNDCIAFAEAFRDKSEAGLREEIERLKRERGPQTAEDGFGSVWPPCEKHNCEMQVMRPGSASCPHCENEDYIDRLIQENKDAETELTELRAKLAAMDKYQDEIAIKWKREIKRVEAAEAEAAALRERERWISVEEKLPESRVWVQGLTEHDGSRAVAPLFGVRDSKSTRFRWECEFTVIAWKALSAAPERGKDGKS